MFPLLQKIEKAHETKVRVTLIDKMGKYFHGTVTDHWVHISAGKMRGKVVFLSDEKGSVEIDSNDVLDVLFSAQ